MSGTLFVVATPIGNLEDISPRALRILREVGLIAAEDTRHTGNLLSRFGITTPTTSLHEHNEHAKSASLVGRLEAGESIALVSDAGTPTLADPGTHLIRQAIAAGLRVEPVPGPNAAIAALSVSGLPNDTFTFLGFPPTRSSDRIKWFEELRTAGRTVIFYESPHRISATLTQLYETVGDVRVSVARELTKKHENLVRGPISSVISEVQGSRGEFTVVVDVGHKTNVGQSDTPDRAQLPDIFRQMTQDKGMTRRQAISAIARRYGLSNNQVYAALENHKKSAI
ncbi:MAG: 16S rRNA (cytidine(1402)-2'-O)-methyltransferase [Luteitalea sp.]|nr:16S rRNA (cytidine(1402)-2'-O)-methyltransferase [Luteitalea sp.]